MKRYATRPPPAKGTSPPRPPLQLGATRWRRCGCWSLFRHGFRWEAILKRGPKHHLTDTALAARLLNLTADTLLSGSSVVPTGLARSPENILGALFESLVTHDLWVYAQANDARISHMRTWNDQREVDIIIEHEGRVIPVEVKLGAEVTRRDTRHLLWLREQRRRHRHNSCGTAGRLTRQRRPLYKSCDEIERVLHRRKEITSNPSPFDNFKHCWRIGHLGTHRPPQRGATDPIPPESDSTPPLQCRPRQSLSRPAT